MSSIPIDHSTTVLNEILTRNQTEFVTGWVREMNGSTKRSHLLKESDLRIQCNEFASLVNQALQSGGQQFSVARMGQSAGNAGQRIAQSSGNRDSHHLRLPLSWCVTTCCFASTAVRAELREIGRVRGEGVLRCRQRSIVGVCSWERS